MSQGIKIAFATVAFLTAGRLFAGDPGPTQSVSPDGNVYHSPIPVNDPFPDANYGADHGGSSLSIVYPYVSQFGYTDHSRGYFLYQVAPFYPRNSEGVFGMDVWLEQEDSSGNWNAVAGQYQPVNTPNPGPSPSYSFTWSYSPFPPNTNFRIFVYVYIYNQGGGSQGDFPIYSSTTSVNTGAANDAPRISWTGSYGSINPTQVQAGQTYTISADAQDDNGNLVAVSINKNGQPFAYAGGGTGYSGNSQNPTSDPVGTETFTAWATDSYGAQSPTISWTVQVIGKSNQAPVSSSNVSFPFFSQNFTPPYYGGSGSGAWQFCVADYTNWDGGNSSYAGTNLGPSPGNSPGADWVPSWTPPGPGTYQFWVAKDGDSNYNPSGAVGLYTLTVTPATPVGSFDGVTPNPVTQGQAISGSGWAADAQLGAPVSSVLILVDGGSNGSFYTSLNGYRPDVQAANTSWGHWSPHDVTYSGWSFSFGTAGLSPGGHTMTAIAYDNAYGVSATIGSQSFTVSAPIRQTVSISPGSQTIYAGNSITFSASGGANGYVWGGNASGGGNSVVVGFPSAGTYTITVYSPGGGGYLQSNTAAVTITVASQPGASITAMPASISVGQSSAISASYRTDSAHGDSLTNSVVNVVSPQGVESNFSSYGGNPINGTFVPSQTGTYTFKSYATTSLSPGWTVYATATVTVSSATQAVSISPPTATISAGGQVAFVATGGANGYVWGGSASGSGNSQTVSFPNTGTYSVNVYSPAGNGFNQSNLAVSMVTVKSIATVFSASPISFTYDGGTQGPVLSSSPAGIPYNLSGTATAINAGSYSFTATATGQYSGTNAFNWSILPANQSPVAISPATATVSAGQSVSFTASGGSGSGAYVWGGAASGTGSATSVTFPNQGNFTVLAYRAADQNYVQSGLASASVTVLNPTYTLTVNAGPGGTATGSVSGLAGTDTPPISASPNSGYAFVLWTGDPVANPASAATTVPMNNANRTVTATFAALQPQTISFTPPATALFPGPALPLTATATSGLPVSFSVLTGPAALAGNVLTFTGTGNVIVQASQSGGWNGSTDYQPAPNVSATIQVNTPFTIIRLRFNSPSVSSKSVDSNNVGHTSTGHGQSSFIWTDPAGIQSSPWPTFNGPSTLMPVQTNIQLPLAPAAGAGQANSTPAGGR
jgi:plastocyanin